MTTAAPETSIAEIADQIARWSDAGLRFLDNTSAVIPYTVVSVAAAYTFAAFDRVVLANATAGAFSVTLPSAVGRRNQQPLIVKRTNAGANAVTVASAGGTIDGAATQSLATQWASITAVSDGSSWYLL